MAAQRAEPGDRAAGVHLSLSLPLSLSRTLYPERGRSTSGTAPHLADARSIVTGREESRRPQRPPTAHGRASQLPDVISRGANRPPKAPHRVAVESFAHGWSTLAVA